MSQNESETFAKQLQDLEAIVQQMEQDHLPLETSLDLYAKGIELTKRCHTLLQQAEDKIKSHAELD